MYIRQDFNSKCILASATFYHMESSAFIKCKPSNVPRMMNTQSSTSSTYDSI